MKLAVIGAGIIGITTAYELAVDGHEVTVFERRAAAAEETSFANAGVVAPGYVTPWAAPGMPGRVLRQMLRRHAAVRLGLPLSADELRWIWKWWRACTPDSYLANRRRLQGLAFYSRQRLHHLSTELSLEYDRSSGYMVLLRSEKDALMVQSGLQLLREAHVVFEEIDAARARSIEPALSTDTALYGAVHLPQDEVGNCRQFALLLKNEAQRLGAVFEFERTVSAIGSGRPCEVHLAGQTAPRRFDGVLLCAGLDAMALLQPLGLKVAMAAVYGYSISAQIREPLNAPRSGLMDEHYKVAISRLGQRVRVAGSAEMGGPPERKRDASLRTLYKVLRDWFPGAAQLTSHAGSVQEWKAARAMLPDGPPVLGASGLPGLWLNLGHGSSGWALSCGSARALADLVSGKTPEVDLEGLDISRLQP
jgi:D-amino-acid dehydrogenase